MSTAPKPLARAKEIPIREAPLPDVRSHMETILKIPADVLRRLVLPDLAVAVVNAEGNTQVTYCNRITFDVTLTPGLISGTGNVAVPYRVTYKSSPSSSVQPGGNGTIYVPAAGGTTRASVGFPMPADASFTPDFTNEITVQIDPDNTIAESDKTNNTITVPGTCVG